MHITQDELKRRFAFHPANTEDKKTRHEQVREVCLGAAEEIVLLTPTSREQSTALTKLEEAMYWANAAIAREIRSEDVT